MNKKIIATNRKAWHEYHIMDKYEAGVILLGSEVKALREGKGNVKEAYVRFSRDELYIIGMHIGEYSHAGYSSHTPVHDRKLLLHQKELKKILRSVEEKGTTLVPLSVYLKHGLIKIQFALAKGKKQYDKRESIKRKDLKREKDRVSKYGKF